MMMSVIRKVCTIHCVRGGTDSYPLYSVIRQTALDKDLSLFDAGDKTEVGEKGITLRFVLCFTSYSMNNVSPVMVKRSNRVLACSLVAHSRLGTNHSRTRSLFQSPDRVAR